MPPEFPCQHESLGSNSPTISDTFLLGLVEDRVRKHYTMQAISCNPAEELAPFSQPFIHREFLATIPPGLLSGSSQLLRLNMAWNRCQTMWISWEFERRRETTCLLTVSGGFCLGRKQERLQSKPLSPDDEPDLQILFQSHSIETRQGRDSSYLCTTFYYFTIQWNASHSM